MANLRKATGSVFGSVAAVAGTITSTFETVNVALDAGNASVSAWALRVKTEAKLSQVSAKERAINAHAADIAEERVEILARGNADAEWKAQFDDARSELEKALEA